ncbi:MAG: TatD family hydrolase, partial [Candidatus Kapabacteria bacterium]|nr:TatD family hydrolase [Candidatus Kapabacteria bacterium]MDW7996841.1 TatD family hydrolase [Bacteroidota bacterium]
MIDTHAHIDLPAFDEDRAEVLQRARQSGVEAVIMPAISPDGFAKARQIAAEYSGVYRAVGIHPHAAAQADVRALAAVEQEVTMPNVVAIGEIGLDYYYTTIAEPAVQQNVFREQIWIAKRCNLPIIVHNRDAHTDVLRLLEEEQDGTLNGVLHCFSGDEKYLQRALALGFCVSFTGNITYQRNALVALLPQVPEDRLVLETDSPYMTPRPYRGKRNEPAFVSFVAAKIAEVTGRTLEQVVQSTTRVARSLFRLTSMLWLLAVPAFPQEASGSGKHLYAKSFGVGVH